MRRDRFVRAGVVAALTMGAALACGSDLVSRTSKVAPSPGLPSAELHGSFLAPPDRALVGVHVSVEAGSYADAADAVREELRLLEVALTDAPGCSARGLQYHRPEARERWHAWLELVVDADLVGLATVAERMDRLDACSSAIAGRLAAGEELPNGAKRWVTTSQPVFTVDAPERYLPELIERRTRGLAAAHAASGAPQLHAEDLRCVPDGTVQIGHRLISGVQLSTSVACRIEGPKPPLVD